jgi:SET domain-containing protein
MACPNPPLTPRINPRHACYRLRVATSAIHRWGVFAEEAIPKNRKVLEYTGEKISRRESKRRADSREDVYLFTLDNYWNIDGAVGGSGAELVNHCCDPNLVVRILKGHILYLSVREIGAGEELTIDYRFGWDVEKVPCKCGSPKCRGVINVKE